MMVQEYERSKMQQWTLEERIYESWAGFFLKLALSTIGKLIGSHPQSDRVTYSYEKGLGDHCGSPSRRFYLHASFNLMENP